MKSVLSTNRYKSAINTQVHTTSYIDQEDFSIRVGSTTPPVQNILSLDMLPPTLRNMIVQEDLDWLIFNLGNIVQTSGRVLKGLTGNVSEEGLNFFYDFTRGVVSTLTKFTGDITSNILNWVSEGTVNIVNGVAQFLRPTSDGGNGGGETLARSIANILENTVSFITTGLTSIVNNLFSGSSNLINATFPLGINLVVQNFLQLIPTSVANAVSIAQSLARNAVLDLTSFITQWGRTLGGYSGGELNIALPRIMNVEKQDVICQWAEWWLFDSDFGKWENAANPLALMAKESLYKSICFQTTVDIDERPVPLFPIGTFWLPHQVKSFINGLWQVSWSSRTPRIESKSGISCTFKDGVMRCNV